MWCRLKSVCSHAFWEYLSGVGRHLHAIASYLVRAFCGAVNGAAQNSICDMKHVLFRAVLTELRPAKQVISAKP